jgi:hypothetical protein
MNLTLDDIVRIAHEARRIAVSATMQLPPWDDAPDAYRALATEQVIALRDRPVPEELLSHFEVAALAAMRAAGLK